MPSKKPTGKPVEKDLQSVISSKGYDWASGITSVSALSDSEQIARLGLIVNEAELKAMQQAISAQAGLEAFATAAFAAPAAVDWRNKGGDWTTPIKDQGGCGSCVSFAVCATIESRINIACNNPNQDPNLSEAHLFFCGCGNCCGGGWNFPPALNFSKNTGIGLETSFPYTPTNQPCRTGIAPYIKIDNWTQLLGTADRKNVLATKGPVVAGMAVYSDFYAYRSGVYRRTSNVLRGYHAVSVVGYDDTQKCWIAKNSWGPGWGESGFFKIGYGESGIDTQFPFYDVELRCPAPPVDPCQQYLVSLRRTLEVARTNPALRLCLRYYVCGKPPRPVCSVAHLNVVRAVLTILQRCPQYRAPFCAALG